jgi:two-component system, LytTR family, response regulator
VADIRVVIADDEPPARRGLVRMLGGHADIAIVGECSHGGEALHAIRTTRPDLVFLDVQMPVLDGFEVLRALGPEPLPLVVFITAFDEYAVRAFEIHAIDYLVKPFSDRRFADMLSRARQYLQQSEAAAVAQRLAALLARDPAAGSAPAAGADARETRDGADARTASLVATTGRRSVVVPIADIDWIEAQDYCVLVHAGKASHLLRESIRTLADRLAPHHFVRVHRSALVNLARVRELRRPPQGEWILVLHGGVELPVSRRLRPVVTRHFARA